MVPLGQIGCSLQVNFMKFSTIAKFLTIAQFTLAGIFTLCLGIAMVQPEERYMGVGWLLCAFATVIFGAFFYFCGRESSQRIYQREVFVTISSSWLLLILIGTLPYLLFLPHLSFADAFFESTSGFTSTGVTLLSDLDHLPRSLLFFRAISQWIGGLGIVIFFVLFLPSAGPVPKLLFSNENMQKNENLFFNGLKSAMGHMLAIYGLLTLCCSFAFYWAGMDLFDAICHALTTISTGGFSTHSDGIAWFHCSSIEWVTIIFMLLGAMNFLCILAVLRLDWEKIKKNSECCGYFAFISLFAIAIFAALHTHGHAEGYCDCLRMGIFHAVSFLSTTGFVAFDSSLWIPNVTVLLIIAVFIGGCSASTAGGVKIIRILVAMKLIWANGERSFRPRIIRPIRIDGKICTEKNQEQMIHYLILFTFVCIFSLPLYALMEPSLSFEGTLSSYIACLSNGGIASGEFLEKGHFNHLHSYAKWFLSLVMLLGRLEMQALFAPLIPKFWRHFS
jgi:trk system potassium uptake protein TrkH